MNITGLRVSIRSLKRNLARLKKGNPTSVKKLRAIEKTEAKIKKQLLALEALDVSPAITRKPREKKQTKFKYGDYEKYIGSAEWAERKSLYYETHHRECRSCGADKKELHLHHRTYARIYQENDSDLMPLCVDCHAALHLFQKTFKMPVEDATAIWISVTNGHSKKKKTREALRCLDHHQFKSLWKKRAKADLSPAQHLTKTIERITSGDIGWRDDVIDDVGAIKKQIAFSSRTGMVKSYDEKVDEIMRKLSHGKRGKK